MSQTLHRQLKEKSDEEAFSRFLGFEVVEVTNGLARVRMRVGSQHANIFGGTHGGVVFSLIDEAFQLASNSHGTLAVALNVSITYVAAPSSDALLEAKVEEVHQTRRTASYYCDVREINGDKRLIATANALAYRTGKEIGW